MKTDAELRADLGKRLAAAAKTTGGKYADEFSEDRWQLVADTIDLMITRAIDAHERRSLGKSGQ